MNETIFEAAQLHGDKLPAKPKTRREFEEVARQEAYVKLRTPEEWKEINDVISRLATAHNRDMDAARERIAELVARLDAYRMAVCAVPD